MAKATTPITLDVVEKKRIQVIVAKQYDTGARELKIRMTNKGIPIFVEKNCVVTINAFRENDEQSKAFGGTTNDDGTVTVPITFWMLENETTVNCDVSVYDEHESKLSTLNFDIEVEKANYSGDEISEDENYDLLITLLADVAEAKQAENERVQAENERVQAENERVQAENERVQAENERVQAENERVQAENEREKDLSQLIANVSKNNKRIANLENRISPELFTTDTDVAYSKDVPENALPYAEITEIGGMTYKDGDTLRSAPVSAVESVGANLLPYPYDDTTKTVNGITFTDNGDGSITVNGTATADAVFNLSRVWIKAMQKYFASGCPLGGSQTTYYLLPRGFGKDTGNGILINGTSSDFSSLSQIVITSGTTVNNLVFKPMLNAGTTAKPYAPYFKRALEIPEAVRALDGYGESNPDNADEYNAIVCEDGKWKYSHKGDIEDNVWTPFAAPQITDISDILPADNFIQVEEGGTVTMVNEYGYDVPSSIIYQIDAEVI